MNNNSREHHWWPVGLQNHWARRGDVNIMYPDGSTETKKFYNRKIGKKSHGHTILRDGGPWKHNFESEFDDADSSISEIVSTLRRQFLVGQIFRDLLGLIPKRFFGRLALADFQRATVFPEDFRRKLTWLCASLLIRSPANRFTWENYPKHFGFAPSEDVGKMNILNQVRGVKRAIFSPHSLMIFHVVIYSESTEFIFGDGLLDSFSSGSQNGILQGRALIPLTPHLCIYMVNPRMMTSTANVSLLFAPAWLVEGINEITQVYSRREIFFASKRPKIAESFKMGEFRQFKYHQSAIISELDALVPELKFPWMPKTD